MNMQAEKEAGMLDEQPGTWFSNPGQDGSTPAVGTGVGKYLAAAKTQPRPGSEARGAGQGQEPAPKKRKAATSYGNFDAW